MRASVQSDIAPDRSLAFQSKIRRKGKTSLHKTVYFSRNTLNLLFLIAGLDSADSKLQYAYKNLQRRNKLATLSIK